jgi:hypothetical protein
MPPAGGGAPWRSFCGMGRCLPLVSSLVPLTPMTHLGQDILRHAVRCIRDGCHDDQNYKEIFKQHAYIRKFYRAGGTIPLDFGKKIYKGATVVDVGAYVGFYAMQCLMLGAEHVICIDGDFLLLQWSTVCCVWWLY